MWGQLALNKPLLRIFGKIRAKAASLGKIPSGDVLNLVPEEAVAFPGGDKHDGLHRVWVWVVLQDEHPPPSFHPKLILHLTKVLHMQI